MTVGAPAAAELGSSPSSVLSKRALGERALGWLEGLLPTLGAILVSLALFGAFVAAAMVLVRRHHTRNVRAGALPTIPSDAH